RRLTRAEGMTQKRRTGSVQLAPIYLPCSRVGRPDSRRSGEQLPKKVRVIERTISQTAFAAAVGVNLLIAPKLPAQAIVAAPVPAHVTTGATAEVERVIVTGSNIPTAEEVGPNPVDTYRPADLEKLGIRNATDLQTFLPQQAGGTTNLNGSGDGTVQFNLRG